METFLSMTRKGNKGQMMEFDRGHDNSGFHLGNVAHDGAIIRQQMCGNPLTTPPHESSHLWQFGK